MSTPLSSLLNHSPSGASDGRADFDFLRGQWRVSHRRLQRRLENDDRWDSFTGTCTARPILGGLGNTDDNELDLPGGAYLATTLRLFRPETRTWSIWWIDSRDPHLEPPVEGRFDSDVGVFFGDDRFNDQPIRVRFIWSHITPASARWEQAFSIDGGNEWETNWRMAFERVA